MGSKDGLQKKSLCTYDLLDCWIWITNAKDMAFGTLGLIASKANFTNQLLDLSSSNANPVNAHTNFDTCH
jgi:hypothetical protein